MKKISKDMCSHFTQEIHRHFLGIIVSIIGTGIMVATAYASPTGDFSGWRGGIGLACEQPSENIRDISELGYDICWGWDDLRVERKLDLTVFNYWNCIIELALKGPIGTWEATWDYSQMADKKEAVRLACEAAFTARYGVKGLSKYAKPRYRPGTPYEVFGSLDLSSENLLVKTVEEDYIGWFKKNGVKRGGIALDNAMRVPTAFMESLARNFNASGLGVATNACPKAFLPYIDLFGYEGFPFSIEYVRTAHENGLRGVLGEFTMQNLSGCELAAYLKNKPFNGIVFFGYIGGSNWLLGTYSHYDHRPDVYDHQRWVFRKYVPLSRSVRSAGLQETACAEFIPAAIPNDASPEVLSDTEPREETTDGKILEYRRPIATMARITGRTSSTKPGIARYGSNISDGVYFYVDSGMPGEVVCSEKDLGVTGDTLVFDAFNEKVLPSTLGGGKLAFKTTEGPSLVVLGNKDTLTRSILSRSAEGLKVQLAQRSADREVGMRYPEKAWENFCQGWKLDRSVASSGSCSLKTEGGTYFVRTPQYSFFNRQGAAQLVLLNQTKPEKIALRVASMAEKVAKSDLTDLNNIAKRRLHFDVREAHTYCIRLYLDYQDGQWPEVHTAAFTPGTHGWEQKSIEVTPSRPVKTAFVLLEYHQPGGIAWFDDVVLTQGESDRNLIAGGSFEENDPVAAKALSTWQAYEQQIDSLVEKLDAVQKSPHVSGELAALVSDANAAAAWVHNQGLEPYFGRELRDLNDLREKLELCARINAIP